MRTKIKAGLVAVGFAVLSVIGVAPAPAHAQTAENIRHSPYSSYEWLYIKQENGIFVKAARGTTIYHTEAYYIPSGWCGAFSIYEDGEYTGEHYRVAAGWHDSFPNATTQVRRYLC